MVCHVGRLRCQKFLRYFTNTNTVISSQNMT